MCELLSSQQGESDLEKFGIEMILDDDGNVKIDIR
jgi:hypothetical protein